MADCRVGLSWIHGKEKGRTFFIVLSYYNMMPYVDGAYYAVSGDGPPLIFLHGILCDSSAYHELLSILSKRYRVYAIDMPMHGRSRTVRDTSISNFCSIIEELIENEKITCPTICAHSAGALVALRFCSGRRFRHLFLLEPAGICDSGSTFRLLSNLFIRKTIHDLSEDFGRAMLILKVASGNLAINIADRRFWTMMKRESGSDESSILAAIRGKITVLYSKEDEVFSYGPVVKRFSCRKDIRFYPVQGNHDWPILKPWLIKEYI